MALTKALGGGGGGGSVNVKEEGSVIVTAATAIDFVAPNLTVTNSSGVAVVTESTYPLWDRDKPPASAHASDDEGTGTAGTTPSGFTAFNSPGGSTAFEYDGKGNIHLFIPSGSGDVLRFWYKTLGAGSYTVTTKLRTMFNSNYNSAGLCIRDSVGAKMLFVGLQQRSAWPNDPTLIYSWWTNSTTWAGETLGPTFPMGSPLYLQHAWNSGTTTLTTLLSRDGVTPFKTWQTSAAWFANAPLQVGIQVNTQSGGDAHAYFDFLRYKAATSDTIGGTRTITGS